MQEIIGYIDKQNSLIDTQSVGDKAGLDPVYFDDTCPSLELIRHSCAHLMAAAIKKLFKDAKFFVGPVIEDGFYYDFKVDAKLGDDDLKQIEQTMKELAKQKDDFIKSQLLRKDALSQFADDELKLYLINKIQGELTTYQVGDFTDLCRGPHVPNTKYLKHFKLTKISGAYLDGNEQNTMLTRIYGTAFASKDALNAHLKLIEEAKKRDHRKLGRELELFAFDEDIGAGLPIWLSKGARLRSKLEQLLFRAHRLRGYEPVRGPELLKSSAWKISGHYDNYGENMYFTTIDEQEYGIKPMNCVGHIKVYESALRSYRELPLKFFEYGVVHRHEKSGVMHGLFRVREFTQDDAHIFCTPEQIKSQIIEVLGFVEKLMGLFGFTYELEISTRPQKAIGAESVWENATLALKAALEEKNLPYHIDEGGGAFYGPKIDIKITDALKRKWQCGTIQVDFNLPDRFKLEYTDEDNTKKEPVMIHRAILGSFERFIGILIEHCAGELPFFIAPVQVGIIPISQAHEEYAKEIFQKLLEIGVDAQIYDKNESLNKRIRTAEKSKLPMIVVLGDEEVASKSVALRNRRLKERSTCSLESFLINIKEQLNEVSF